MARLGAFAVLIALLAPLEAAAATEAKSGRDAFTIELPAGCSLSSPQRGPDFEVFGVSCGAATVVGIYAGNYPNIDQGAEGLAVRQDGGGRSLIVHANNVLRVRGYLWETAYSWPSRLHVWIVADRELDPTAQAIAASVRPTTPAP